MKAVNVVRDSHLEVLEVPPPVVPPPEHLHVQIEGCALNHGDKYFLQNPAARAIVSALSNSVWGASGAGLVVAVGENVPAHYLGKRVAMYRSLVRTPETIGLWCETAQVHHLNCVVLPENVNALDYSGSLVNAITAYAFIDQITDDGHKGMIATAGNSATGRCLLQLAKLKGVPCIALVRSANQRTELEELGFTNILVTSEHNFIADLELLALKLNTTAVFEGVGGSLISQIAPVLPPKSTFYFYGFLSGADSFTMQSRMMLEKNLSMRSFSNFMSRTVQDKVALSEALRELSAAFEHPVFRTRVGQQFSFADVNEAMQYKGDGGLKPVLVP